mgnify:CR=1 FL=1|tara:strand:+ start:57 stop:650 length:594 start_codon:yes stop_codon:yes gene_type:complete
MISKTIVSGRVIKKYKISLDLINDLNEKYELHKKTLNSFGPRLAGRLDSELEFTNKISECKISKTIVDCMHDYIENLEKVNLYFGKKDLEILSCWINDMQEGEYNPPHTHHDNTGWSSVMFLKIPEFINDAKDPHKFKDGSLGFIDVNGSNCIWQKPEIGDFYIFEASHQHCVMPFKLKNKQDIRRSMSFNFIDKIV